MKRVILLIDSLAMAVVLTVGCDSSGQGNAIPPNASNNCVELAKYISTLPELITNECLSVDVAEFNRSVFMKCSLVSNGVELVYIAHELEDVALQIDLGLLDFQGWQKAQTWIRESFYIARGVLSRADVGDEAALECWFREIDFFNAEGRRCDAEARRCDAESRLFYALSRAAALSGCGELARDARAVGRGRGRESLNFQHQATLCRDKPTGTPGLVDNSEYGILARFCRENPDKADKMISRVSKCLGRKPKWSK